MSFEAAFLKSFVSGPGNENMRKFVDAILTKDQDELQEVVDSYDRGGPSDLHEDLQKFHDFRDYYDDGKIDEMPPEERMAVREYEWKWILELAYRMYGFIPEELIGAMPVPPEVKKLMPMPAPAPEPILNEEREAASIEVTGSPAPVHPRPHAESETEAELEAEPKPEPEF